MKICNNFFWSYFALVLKIWFFKIQLHVWPSLIMYFTVLCLPYVSTFTTLYNLGSAEKRLWLAENWASLPLREIFSCRDFNLTTKTLGYTKERKREQNWEYSLNLATMGLHTSHLFFIFSSSWCLPSQSDTMGLELKYTQKNKMNTCI